MQQYRRGRVPRVRQPPWFSGEEFSRTFNSTVTVRTVSANALSRSSSPAPVISGARRSRGRGGRGDRWLVAQLRLPVDQLLEPVDDERELHDRVFAHERTV